MHREENSKSCLVLMLLLTDAATHSNLLLDHQEKLHVFQRVIAVFIPVIKK